MPVFNGPPPDSAVSTRPDPDGARRNERGVLSLGDWRFQLPAEAFGSVLVLGGLGKHLEEVLEAQCDRLTVASSLREARKHADHGFDLIVLQGSRAVQLLSSKDALQAILELAAPHGFVYTEVTGRRRTAKVRKRFERLPNQLAITDELLCWLAGPRRGFRVMVPATDRRMIRYLCGSVLCGLSLKARTAMAVSRLAARLGLVRFLIPGRAFILRKAGADGVDRPARSIAIELAARSGIEIPLHRSAFLARGSFDSNKGAFFLFPPGAESPELVLKFARAPKYNGRLDREYEALRAVARGGWVADGTYPQALFRESHLGLAVVGQRVAMGAPFRSRSRATADCAYVASAIEWITDLGEGSARGPRRPGPGLRQRFEQLWVDFQKTYGQPAAERRWLANAIQPLLDDGDRVPPVFQHGDAHLGNILINRAGIVMLDWEACDAEGVPLWDLFQFMSGVASWAGRLAGERDPVTAYEQLILTRSAYSALQSKSVSRYCRRIGLGAELVPALFYAGWMHRAMRQARWTRGPLVDAKYYRLLSACIRAESASDGAPPAFLPTMVEPRAPDPASLRSAS